MKNSIASILLLFISSYFGDSLIAKENFNLKDSVGRFSICFTTFNHAERISEGTTSYLLTDTSIVITKIFFGDTKSKTVYSNIITKPQVFMSIINKVELDSLEDYYFNNCIMTTSGNEYFLSFECNTKKKSISLHHYYLKQLDEIIQIINSNLPVKYQYQYLTRDTKQDCKY